MGKIEYELKRTVPGADARDGGSRPDPLKGPIDPAAGRYGAVPAYILAPRNLPYEDRVLGEFAAQGRVSARMPLRLMRNEDSDWFTLPFEPLVTVSGRNIITRRSVAKGREPGTVKERWSQDDYEVIIQGVLTAASRTRYPRAQMSRLLELFAERKALEVDHELLAVFGIRYLAVESVHFPHTKGLNNQNYEIRAYSDRTINLLIPM